MFSKVVGVLFCFLGFAAAVVVVVFALVVKEEGEGGRESSERDPSQHICPCHVV